MTHSWGESLGCKGITSAMLALLIASCGDDGSSNTTPDDDGGNVGGNNNGGSTPTDGIDEAVLAKCPQSSALLEEDGWTTCVEGKRLVGTDEFAKKPCELRIGKNGVFEYFIDGDLAIAVPERGTWLDSTGTYQNNASSGSRFFLASIAPDLEPVEGEPRVDRITISLFALEGKTDTVEIRYVDEKLMSQTYNCTVDAL